MAVLFLSLYIALIFIRPMDWWAPVQGWRLVDYAAILTLFAAFTAYPRVLSEHMKFTQIPEVLIAMLLLLGVTFSWLYPFYGRAIVFSFQTFGKVILLFAVIVLLARHPRNLQILKWVVIVSIILLTVHTMLQMRDPDGGSVGFGGKRPRWRVHGGVWQPLAFGIFNDPNDLCLVFIIALPLLYAEMRASDNSIVKFICGCFMVMAAYSAYLTNSRGGWVGILGMLAAYAIAHTKGWWRWAVAGGFGVLVTTIAPSRFSAGFGVDIGRLNAWGDGLAAFQRFPIFGTGFTSFRDYTEDWTAAHNSFIEALTELGLVGYVPWFLLIFTTMLHLRRTINLKEFISPADRFRLSGLFSALAGYLTASYFLSRAYREPLYILLGFAVAQVIVACHEKNLYEQVFGRWKKDVRWGVFWALASIPIIWITVRIANMLGR